MENKNKAMFIVNPASGNGRTYRKWQKVEKILRSKGYQFEVRFTEYQLHASQICDEALHNGYNHIIAVGGDGTINEVLNGFYYGSDKDNNPAMSVVPMGTGSDFSRHLGLSGKISYIEKLLVNGEECKCDVIRATYQDWDEKEACRYFINVADVGIGSETVYRVNNNSKAWGGFLSFFRAVLASIFSFQSPVLTVEVNGREIYSGKSAVAVVSNGKYFGGGVMVAPHAEINDGELDVLVVEDLKITECLRLLPAVYKGRHLKSPHMRSARGQDIRFSSPQKIFLEVDGESPGTGDVHFQLLPSDLQLIL